MKVPHTFLAMLVLYMAGYFYLRGGFYPADGTLTIEVPGFGAKRAAWYALSLIYLPAGLVDHQFTGHLYEVMDLRHVHLCY